MMAQTRTSKDSVAARLRPRLYFSKDQARQAVPYLKLIVRDLRTAFENATYFGAQMKCAGVSRKEAQVLQREQDAAIERFNRCVDELDGLGVELRDCRTGLVAIPARFYGREIRYLWWPEAGEIAAWQNLDDEPFRRRELADLAHPTAASARSPRSRVDVWAEVEVSDRTA